MRCVTASEYRSALREALRARVRVREVQNRILTDVGTATTVVGVFKAFFRNVPKLFKESWLGAGPWSRVTEMVKLPFEQAAAIPVETIDRAVRRRTARRVRQNRALRNAVKAFRMSLSA